MKNKNQTTNSNSQFKHLFKYYLNKKKSKVLSRNKAYGLMLCYSLS